MTVPTDAWAWFSETVTQAFGVVLSQAQLQQFKTLYRILIQANETTNLTRITDLNDVIVRHYLDSLSLIPHLSKYSEFSLIDIGSGAGFPVLPLAIMAPQVSMVAVESVQKKGKFIEAAANQLGLSKVIVSSKRCEALGQQSAYREQFDVVVSRAVASLPVLLEYTLPFAKPPGEGQASGGRVWLYKTQQQLHTELQASAACCQTLGGGAMTVHPVTVESLAHHCLVEVPKIRSTPADYPRREGIPSKTPLG